ncbi:hypothetical protein SAMD00019534_084600 [Acytostelium subglobosum LB1]|uniref:hypothetical protein n=1 Tax=Acytostelium subglobosum LB1 TaxID=1410327 RepID=UPI000644BFFF|nr:hypothetical protein SAMD00019534_084600 [Acytostelium subglobosum LB1]GAM25285.1 hypothetical protein SAMD00019534_084600 [Acytostelium subglobosum LB1]|eukprot:XP_012751805.1 hypothetical protein SAMD00019534_084600 [Acytostelium subglobosum LB1]
MNQSFGNHGSSAAFDDDMPTDTMKKASAFIMEMEQMIKDELAMLEKFYVTDHQDVPYEKAINKAKRKFEKRRGPTLIKPLNKKKNRIVVGDMEFDPVARLWKGNDSDLVNFPRGGAPALITNMGRNEERVVGNMKWDPRQKEWKGNEADLSKFRKPGLITPLNSMFDTKVQNGMVLDPVSMKWRGNEDDLDVFETMDDQNNDNTFTEEGEFNMTKTLLDTLKESERQHESLSGWFTEERDLEDREFLRSIRQMSIAKLIKNTTKLYHQQQALKDGGSTGPANGGLMDSINVLPMLLKNKKKVVDETNDWDDVDFSDKPALKLKLNLHQDANDQEDDLASTWDKEMGFTSDDDVVTTSGGSRNQTPRSNSVNNMILNTPAATTPGQKQGSEEWTDYGTLDPSKLDKYREKEDLSDDDLDWSGFGTNSSSNNNNNNTSTNSIISNSNKSAIKKSTGLKTILGGSISKTLSNFNDKGGSLKRGGTLNNIPPLSISNSSTPISSSNSTTPNQVEEYFDDVEIKGPLALKQRMHADNFDQFDDMSSASSKRNTPISFGHDIVEEEWPDVHIPADLATKRPNDITNRKTSPVNKQTIEDYSDELAVPNTSAPLILKKPQQLSDNPFGDDSDEGWDDVYFPDNFKGSPVQNTLNNFLSTPNSNTKSSPSTSSPPTPLADYHPNIASQQQATPFKPAVKRG